MHKNFKALREIDGDFGEFIAIEHSGAVRVGHKGASCIIVHKPSMKIARAADTAVKIECDLRFEDAVYCILAMIDRYRANKGD